MVSEVQVCVWDGGECPWEQPPYQVKEAVLVQLRTRRNPHPGGSGLCIALQGPPESGRGPGPLYLSSWQSLRLAVIEACSLVVGGRDGGSTPTGLPSHLTAGEVFKVVPAQFSLLYSSWGFWFSWPVGDSAPTISG